MTTWLFLGDSTIIDDGSRVELGRLLDLAGHPHQFVVEAHAGFTVPNFIPIVQGLVAQHQPDVICVALGTNDSNPANGISPNKYDTNYAQLINNALAGWPAAKFCPLWIQYSSNRAPWSTNGMLNNEAAFNDAVYRQSINRAPRVIWPPADFQSIPEIYLQGPPDSGLHPTLAGQTIYGRLWYKAMAATFGLPLAFLPVTCGLMGSRPGTPPPVYVQCGELALP